MRSDAVTSHSSRQNKPLLHLVVERLLNPIVLVFNVDDIKNLRENHGISGVLTGTLAPYPQQNFFLSVPLRLLHYECLYLLEKNAAVLADYAAEREKLLPRGSLMQPKEDEGILITTTNEEPCNLTNSVSFDTFKQVCIEQEMRCMGNSKLDAKYSVYRMMKSMGFYISPGLKFGGDFVLYPGDPLEFHSYSVVRLDFVATNDLVVGGRLATGVKKNLVVVDVPDKTTDESPIRAYSIQWAGFG